MRALAEEEAAACPLCGMPRAVCGRVGDDFAFEATSRRCFATQAIAQRQDAETHDDVATRSIVWGARHREGRQLVHEDLDALDAVPPPLIDS